MGRARPLLDKFWEKVDRDGPAPVHRPELGQCWIWRAFLCRNGYGQYTMYFPETGTKKKVLVHRLSWELTNGRIPPGTGYHGTEVMHKCDNKACVRPDHLELGSHQENMKDMDKNGRRVGLHRPGASNPNSTLTARQAIEIRCNNGMMSGPRMGNVYGIGSGAVYGIWTEKNWRPRQ